MGKGYDKEKKRIRDAQWREAHREELREKQRKYYAENKEKRKESSYKARSKRSKEELRAYNTAYHRKRRAAVRQQIHDLLGIACVRCGYNDDPRALQVDHIDGGGCAERSSFPNLDAYYRHIVNILKSGVDHSYRILCANCNAITRAESAGQDE